MSQKIPSVKEIHALVDTVSDNWDEILIKVRKIKDKNKRLVVIHHLIEHICHNTNITMSDIFGIVETIKLNSYLQRYALTGTEELVSLLQNNQGIKIPKRDVGVA